MMLRSLHGKAEPITRKSRLPGILAVVVLALSALSATTPANAYVAGSNKSDAGPAIVSCQAGESQAWEYLAFTGTNGELNLLQYYDPESFNKSGENTVAHQYVFTAKAVGAPSLACVDEPYGTLYMAWRNPSNNIDVGIITVSGSSASLSTSYALAETTDASPAISADAGSYLAVAWAGTDSSHHINVDQIGLYSGGISKTITSSYTRANAGIGIGWDGEPAGQGDVFTIGFIAPSGTPYIYLGQYDADVPSTDLSTVHTSQYSPYAPAVSESGQYLPSGGFRPDDDGTVYVLWRGDSSDSLYAGIWIGQNIISEDSQYSDMTPLTPAIDGCATAYLGTNSEINYDTEPFFGKCSAAS